jgi:sec-independent protein translocase protein TatB
MLEVGWSEILVIALILIIVVGPKDLPPMLRTFGRMAARLRGMANEFKGQFDQAIREAELDDVRKGLGEVSKLNPTNSLRDAINPIRKLGEDIKSDLRKASDMNTPAAASPVTEGSSTDSVTETAPADPLVASEPAPLMQAAVAPVVPPVAETAATPAADSQPYVPHVAETPKPARKKVAALDAAPDAAVASPAEPKTRKAPVKTRDAAIAAVAAEASAKKPASRRKPVVSEVALDTVAADEASPKRAAARKKAGKAADDTAGEA